MRPADPSEWSRFRGPNGTGVSSSTGLPAEFGPSTNVVWKAAVPAGHSSPVLTTAQIFLTAYEGDRLLVLAFDRKNGREQWRREVPRHQKGHLDGPNSPASPSPVSDGERVYAFFQESGLTAFAADGKSGGTSSRPVQHGIGSGIADSWTASSCSPLTRTSAPPPARAAREKRVQGRSSWRDLRLFDSKSYQPKSGPKDPRSREFSALGTRSKMATAWWVRGLACEMKSMLSIEDDVVKVMGFPQNQAGSQVLTVPFGEGLAKYDANKMAASRPRRSRRRADGQDAARRVGFPAFDSMPTVARCEGVEVSRDVVSERTIAPGSGT
jgi:hypothetical protein